MGGFLCILIFLSCLNSNIESLIKCLDSGPANKRRRLMSPGKRSTLPSVEIIRIR